MSDESADTALALISVETASLVSKVIELASNPNTNADMFDRLVAWQEREQARQSEIAYNTAMNAAQAEIFPVARLAENKQTSSFYAKLEHVDAAIRPIYLRHGFSLEFNTVAPLTPGHIRVEGRCSHVGGHSRLFHREAPADTLGPKGAPVKTVLHGGGSTETYLKRYMTCGVFNVVFRNADDDGNRGGMVFLTTDHLIDLESLIAETSTDLRRFLQVMCSDVHSLEEVEEKDYMRLRNALDQKRRAMQARGQD